MRFACCISGKLTNGIIAGGFVSVVSPDCVRAREQQLYELLGLDDYSWCSDERRCIKFLKKNLAQELTTDTWHVVKQKQSTLLSHYQRVAYYMELVLLLCYRSPLLGLQKFDTVCVDIFAKSRLTKPVTEQLRRGAVIVNQKKLKMAA